MGCAASNTWRDDPSNESPEGGSWKSYKNIDMCMQGDAEIIWDWKSKATISQLKRTVEARGFSAFTVSSGVPSFGHAALKNFDFQLREHHCKPITSCCHHPCTIYIYTPPAHKAKPEGGPKPQLCLVPATDPRRIVLEHAAELAGGPKQCPLTLASHPGYAIVRNFAERRDAFTEWQYTALAIGPAAEAITCALIGGRLVEPGDGVVTPSMLDVKADNHLDLVWNKHSAARLVEEAAKRGTQPCTFTVDADGSIACAGNPGLRLGMRGPPQPPPPGQEPKAVAAEVVAELGGPPVVEGIPLGLAEFA